MKKIVALVVLAGFTAACTPVNNATPPYPGLPMPEKHVEQKNPTCCAKNQPAKETKKVVKKKKVKKVSKTATKEVEKTKEKSH